MYQEIQAKEWKEALADFEPSNGLSPIKRGMICEILKDSSSASAGEFEAKFYQLCCPLTGLKGGGSMTVSLTQEDLKKLRTIDEPKKIDTRLLVGGVAIVSLTILGLANQHYLSAQLARLVQWSGTLGWWCPVLLFGVSATLPVIMLPAFPMMALSGPLFTKVYGGNPVAGGAMAFVSVFGGLWLGSVIAFALGKTVFKEYAIRAGQESATLKQLNRIIDSGGVKIVLMARALPILPAEIFDYAAALTSLEIWQYAIGCIGSAIPVAFWTFSSAEASAAASDGVSGKEGVGSHVWLIVINVVALGALTVLLYYTIKSHTPPGEEEDAVVSTSPAHIFTRRFSSSFRSLTLSLREENHDEEQGAKELEQAEGGPLFQADKINT